MINFALCYTQLRNRGTKNKIKQERFYNNKVLYLFLKDIEIQISIRRYNLMIKARDNLLNEPIEMVSFEVSSVIVSGMSLCKSLKKQPVNYLCKRGARTVISNPLKARLL